MKKIQNDLCLFSTLFVLVFSLFNTVTVFADDGTPPPPPGVMPAPTQEAVQPAATDAPPATDEPVASDIPAATEAPAEDRINPDAPVVEAPPADAPAEGLTVPEALVQLPEGTDLIVLDQNGEALPLASADAADVLAAPDPYFKVGSTTYHFFGAGGDCSAYTLGTDCFISGTDTPIQDAIDFLSTNNYTPNDGNIYVESSPTPYNEPVTVDGSSWTTTPTYLGIIGAGSGSTFLDGSFDFEIRYMNAFTLSGFTIDGTVYAHDNSGTLTLNDLVVTNSVGGSGIFVGLNPDSGDVNLTKVNASDNAGMGAYIWTTEGGNVTVADSVFINNGRNGLAIRTDDTGGTLKSGNVILTNVHANSNNQNADFDPSSWNGTFANAYIDTQGGDVTITGSEFNLNKHGDCDPGCWGGDGLDVLANGYGPDGTRGSITLKSVTANNNGDNGAYLDGENIYVSNSQFSGNSEYPSDWFCDDGEALCALFGAGLQAYSGNNGVLQVNAVNASENYGFGAVLLGENIFVSHSTFNGNGLATQYLGPGYDLWADGLLAAHSVASIVSITCSQANNNPAFGFEVYSGDVILDNVTSSGNGWGDDPFVDATGSVNVFNGPCGGGGGNKKVTLDAGVCDGLAANATFLTPRGDFATFPCPINDQAFVQPLKEDKLPGALGDGQKFLSALVTSVIRDNQPVDALENAALVSFLIPEGVDPTTLAILFWDGTQWSDLGGAVSADGLRFEVSTQLVGTFVLVSK